MGSKCPNCEKEIETLADRQSLETFGVCDSCYQQEFLQDDMG